MMRCRQVDNIMRAIEFRCCCFSVTSLNCVLIKRYNEIQLIESFLFFFYSHFISHAVWNSQCPISVCDTIILLYYMTANNFQRLYFLSFWTFKIRFSIMRSYKAKYYWISLKIPFYRIFHYSFLLLKSIFLHL